MVNAGQANGAPVARHRKSKTSFDFPAAIVFFVAA